MHQPDVFVAAPLAERSPERCQWKILLSIYQNPGKTSERLNRLQSFLTLGKIEPILILVPDKHKTKGIR